MEAHLRHLELVDAMNGEKVRAGDAMTACMFQAVEGLDTRMGSAIVKSPVLS